MYVKPTDSTRYLHRRSYHSRHTFGGIPFSQFRRAAVICSDYSDREACIGRMEEKFVNSGYKPEHLQSAKQRALDLDREGLLSGRMVSAKSQQKVLAMVVNQDPNLKRMLSEFFRERETELHELLGDVKLVISERRHFNTSSLLFKKAGFSENVLPLRDDQKCKSARCKTRDTMKLQRSELVNGYRVKLDFRRTCSTENIIYLAKCKRCEDPGSESNFYFGQTINSLMKRCNGHRDKFKVGKEDQSALSLHIRDKHPDYFSDKLLNFDFGVVKQVVPSKLDRAEDFYIFNTNADIKGLNRYKVAKC